MACLVIMQSSLLLYTEVKRQNGSLICTKNNRATALEFKLSAHSAKEQQYSWLSQNRRKDQQTEIS